MKKLLTMFIACVFTINTYAALIIPMASTDDNAKSFGYVEANDTIYGLILTPHLTNLPPGIHGFHVHTAPFCTNHAEAAGGHLDPMKTNRHLGPYAGNGHLGDLPVLIVNQQGKATLPVLAPRLKTVDIKSRALMIHAGEDNYADMPKMGGGGMRLACGVIPDFS